MPLVSGCTSAEKFSMEAVYGRVLTYFVSRFQKCTMSSLAVSSVESSRNLQAYTWDRASASRTRRFHFRLQRCHFLFEQP